MIREIVTDIEQLRQISEPCPLVCPHWSVSGILQDLRETFEACKAPAVGLAAPQIGIRHRVVAIREGGGLLFIVNPIVLRLFGGFYTSREGCLSVPTSIGLPISVRRRRKIRIRYTDGCTGDTVERTFRGFPATVVQHEIDHLDGIVIGDRRGNLPLSPV